MCGSILGWMEPFLLLALAQIEDLPVIYHAFAAVIGWLFSDTETSSN